MLSVALWMIVDIVLNSMMWIVDAARHSFQTLWIRCRGHSAYYAGCAHDGIPTRLGVPFRQDAAQLQHQRNHKDI